MMGKLYSFKKSCITCGTIKTHVAWKGERTAIIKCTNCASKHVINATVFEAKMSSVEHTVDETHKELKDNPINPLYARDEVIKNINKERKQNAENFLKQSEEAYRQSHLNTVSLLQYLRTNHYKYEICGDEILIDVRVRPTV